MQRPAVVAMYQRRGQLLEWLHAVPIPLGELSGITGAPVRTLGGERVVEGNFGEQYLPGRTLRGYFQRKSTTLGQEGYGMQGTGGAQITFALPYTPEPGVAGLTPIAGLAGPTVDDYNAGRFAQARAGESLALDRFVISGWVWQALGEAVPIIDSNEVVAWRVQLGLIADVSAVTRIVTLGAAGAVAFAVARQLPASGTVATDNLALLGGIDFA